jgi:hypothetical protein
MLIRAAVCLHYALVSTTQLAKTIVASSYRPKRANLDPLMRGHEAWV